MRYELRDTVSVEEFVDAAHVISTLGLGARADYAAAVEEWIASGAESPLRLMNGSELEVWSAKS